MAGSRRVAFVHGVPVGVGGLGVEAAHSLRALADGAREVHAIGPGAAPGFVAPPNVTWHVAPSGWGHVIQRSPARRAAGLLQRMIDGHIGRFAAARAQTLAPDLCYAFSQVALETLEWARANGVAGVLENANGHMRGFRDVYVSETARWCGGTYLGHPTGAMVERAEREYATATTVRVSSEWAHRSMVAHGVPPDRVVALPQPLDLVKYSPRRRETPRSGAFRLCYVGALDLRKGFGYLLQAARKTTAPVAITLVGGTGDRCSKRVLDRERQGLQVDVAPGDPRDALSGADLFVLPTLEDGWAFALIEAMASGVPVVTTSSAGAAQWVRHGQTGWVVEPRSASALATAINEAIARRKDLPAMGAAARADVEARVSECHTQVAAWVAGL